MLDRYWVRLVYYDPYTEVVNVREWQSARTATYDVDKQVVEIVDGDNRFLLKVGGENEAKLISFEIDNPMKFMDNEKIIRELQDLCAAGQKIQAIKRYREYSGVELKEARAFVDDLPPKKNKHDDDEEAVPF